MSCADSTQAHWVDVEHQPTDLAVGGSNPSRRATKGAGQRHCGGLLNAGRLPDCDPIATPLAGTPDTAATPCDPTAHTNAASPEVKVPPAAAVGDGSRSWLPDRRPAGHPLSCPRSWPGARAFGGDLLADPISAGDRTSTYAQGARTPALHHRSVCPGYCPSGGWSGRAARSASRD
jgi:hypothetical protein